MGNLGLLQGHLRFCNTIVISIPMPKVVFTSNLKRHLDCPEQTVPGRTVREVFDGLFLEQQQLRGYILDDQDGLRQHVAIFVDGRLIVDRVGLQDAVEESSEIYVMQALSGG